MSSSWPPNEAAAVQNHNGAAFNPLQNPNGGSMLDPSSFMTGSNNPYDNPHFQNSQMQQRMQNGTMRNPSPSFQAPYQTQPVVPSKRSRPREDSIGAGASPRQASGNPPPGSRSQTPQQGGYPGYQAGNQSSQQPNQFAHLQQNGSANASPSPVMNNQLRPGAVPQRVSTASPHPYSPAGPQFAPHGSPSQSEHGGRIDTPQSHFIQNPNFQPSFNQAFPANANRGSVPPQGQGGMPTAQMPQPQHHMQQPSQMYQQGRPPNMPPNMDPQQMMQQQMRRQHQMQAGNLMNAQRMHNMPPGQSPMQRPQMPALNGQYPQGAPPQMQQSRPNNARQLMESLSSFMRQRNMPLEMSPVVGDKPVNIVMILMTVLKHGGYKKVTAMNLWPQVVQALQINPMQYPQVPQQLKSVYEQNLMLFEDAYAQQQARQKAQMIQGGQMPGSSQSSPVKQMNMGPQPQNPQFMAQMQMPQMMQPNLPSQQSTPVKQMGQQAPMNGYMTPGVPPQSSTPTHNRNGHSRTMEGVAQNGTPQPSVGSAGRGSMAIPSASAPSPAIPTPYEMPREYVPRSRINDTYGGISGLDQTPDSFASLADGITNLKPNIPAFHELGLVDVHAITMSLQSGIHSEVRLALDTLATLSVENRLQMDLKLCEDLVESLIDCAETQVDLLAENAAEVSDVMLITSYEDVVRGCRCERDGLQDVSEFGSLDYELDRAVERLICITTIIRNFSFLELNQPPLADELVIKFLCTVIRYLGTHDMLLRTNAHTLDFMKDIIIFLSNLAHAIEIPGKEQALCLLHFLLAFAPTPPPFSAAHDRVSFASYDPAIHRYLPPAVDSLAKLLARDEPNRTFYKTLFTSDVNSQPSYDLLTKSFGLAISPIPAKREDNRLSLMQMVEARKPHLMQGMLAADILSNLVPSFETNLARAWLTSEDGFAQSLLHLITVLSSAAPPPPPRGPPQSRSADEDALLNITLSSISVLKRLSVKARNADDSNANGPLEGMIKPVNLLGALLLKQPRAEVIKQLCAYASTGR